MSLQFFFLSLPPLQCLFRCQLLWKPLPDSHRQRSSNLLWVSDTPLSFLFWKQLSCCMYFLVPASGLSDHLITEPTDLFNSVSSIIECLYTGAPVLCQQLQKMKTCLWEAYHLEGKEALVSRPPSCLSAALDGAPCLGLSMGPGAGLWEGAEQALWKPINRWSPCGPPGEKGRIGSDQTVGLELKESSWLKKERREAPGVEVMFKRTQGGVGYHRVYRMPGEGLQLGANWREESQWGRLGRRQKRREPGDAGVGMGLSEARRKETFLECKYTEVNSKTQTMALVISRVVVKVLLAQVCLTLLRPMWL